MAAPPLMREIRDGFLDHPTWAGETLSVRSRNGQVIPYVLQPSQLKLWAAVQRCIEAGKPIRIIVLKARQVMMSTAVAGLFY